MVKEITRSGFELILPRTTTLKALKDMQVLTAKLSDEAAALAKKDSEFGARHIGVGSKIDGLDLDDNNDYKEAVRQTSNSKRIIFLLHHDFDYSFTQKHYERRLKTLPSLHLSTHLRFIEF